MCAHVCIPHGPSMRPSHPSKGKSQRTCCTSGSLDGKSKRLNSCMYTEPLGTQCSSAFINSCRASSSPARLPYSSWDLAVLAFSPAAPAAPALLAAQLHSACGCGSVLPESGTSSGLGPGQHSWQGLGTCCCCSSVKACEVQQEEHWPVHGMGSYKHGSNDVCCCQYCLICCC